MPVFFLLAVAAGVFTVGSVGGNAQRDQAHRGNASMDRQQAAAIVIFDASSYDTASDCLTAAALVRAPRSACAGKQ